MQQKWSQHRFLHSTLTSSFNIFQENTVILDFVEHVHPITIFRFYWEAKIRFSLPVFNENNDI